MNTKNYIAIDIAKDHLQVQTDQQSLSLPYTEAGLRSLLKLTLAEPSSQVICEATGGYERPLMDFLHAHGCAVTLVNPARVRAFARSDGLKAKTDPIDARLLLRFAQQKQPAPTLALEPARAALAHWLDRRSQLTEQLAREKNRLGKCVPALRADIETMIAFIQERLKRLETTIRQVVAANAQLRQQAQIMQSVDGVGETTAWHILAYLSEIQSLGRNQLVALAGLAPFNRDSGKTRGKRFIQAGRAKVRKCLFMAAKTAAIHNPHIKQYVEGLRQRGKPYKCAIVAAMRKLLIHLQALIKKQQTILAS